MNHKQVIMVIDGHLFMIGHLRGRNLDPIPQPSHTSLAVSKPEQGPKIGWG